MDEDAQLVWLIERNHEAYLTWIALWLASAIGIVTVLVSVILVQGTLSVNHLRLIWLLYWGLVCAMIFSVYRLVNCVKQNLSWALNLKDCGTMKGEAEKLGGLAGFFAYVKSENNDKRAEIYEIRRIFVYFTHLFLAGILFGLVVGNPCGIIETAFIIFVASTLLSLGLVETLKKGLIKSGRPPHNSLYVFI